MKKNEQFKKYSNYYDQLYTNKDYKGEAGFILKVIKRFGKKVGSGLLSLGCGTGTYEYILAKNFKEIVGIDLSREMIGIAKKKMADTENCDLELKLGDIRNFRTNKRFDTVMAMFNIAGYQTTNNDFEKFIKTASYHLKKAGLFIFDAWYQPAVLKNRPTDKTKEIKIDNQTSVLRKTTQSLDVEKSLLNINFEVDEITNGKTTHVVREQHPMRFFTRNEIEYFLEKGGFELVKICKFMDLNEPISEKEWNVFVVARKI